MDLGWSQDEWTEFFEKFGPLMSIYWTLFDSVLLMESNEAIMEAQDDPDRQLTYWELEGVRLGKNTDSFGRISCSIAALYGGTTVSLYKNHTRLLPELVAQGTRIGNGEVTLTERNDSGLSGRVWLNGLAANTEIYVNVYQGLLAQVGTLVERDKFDAQAKANLLAGLPDITASFVGAITRIRDMAQLILLQSFAPDKLETAEDAVIAAVETQASDGTITVTHYGIGKMLIDAMQDQSAPAGSQAVWDLFNYSVVDSTDPDNQGTGSLPATFYDFVRMGTIAFECITGGLGSEEFEVSAKDENGMRIIGNFRLRVDAIYRSIDLGIKQAILSRTITEVAGSDPENLFSIYAAQGVTDTHSDGGRIYFRYAKGTNILSAYSDAARTSLIAQATGVVGPGVVSLSEQSDSGLTAQVTWTGVDPITDPYDFAADASEFEIGDKFFKKLVPDWRYFEIARIATFFGRLFGIILPVADPAIATIKDGIAYRGFRREKPPYYWGP